MKNKIYSLIALGVTSLIAVNSYSAPNRSIDGTAAVPGCSFGVVSKLVSSGSIIFENTDSVGPKYLYLLMAYEKHWSDVDYQEDYDPPTYPIILWRLEDSSLFIVDTLNFDFSTETRLDRLYHFPDQKWFFIHERPLISQRNILNYPGKIPDFYSVLDYDGDKICIRREDSFFNGDRGDNAYYKWFLKKEVKFLLYNETKGRGRNRRFFAIDKFLNRQEIFPEIEFQHPINNGEAGFRDGVVSDYAFSKNQGELVISFNLGNEQVEDNPKAWLQLPVELRLQKADLMLIIVRPEWRYLVAKPRFYNENSNDSLGNTVLIHDYQENTWEYIKLPGDYTIISSYGNWLYGMTRNFWNRDREIEKDSFNLLSSRYGRKYTGKYGEIPQRWQGFTGMHYLYHIPSKKLVEWNARDRDSEILTIQDGLIYYRVYDEIRKVPLNEEKLEITWKEEKVTAKDKDIIPHVHHIFWAGKSQQ